MLFGQNVILHSSREYVYINFFSNDDDVRHLAEIIEKCSLEPNERGFNNFCSHSREIGNEEFSQSKNIYKFKAIPTSITEGIVRIMKRE